MIRPHPADADLARYVDGELTREELRDLHPGHDLERSLDLHEELTMLASEPVALPEWAAIAPSLADEPGRGRRKRRRAFALLLAGGLVVAPAVAEAVSPGSVRRTILDPVADVLPFVGDDDTEPDHTDTDPDPDADADDNVTDPDPDHADTADVTDDGGLDEPVGVAPDEPAPDEPTRDEPVPDDRSGDARPDAEPDPPPPDQPADPPRDEPDPPPPDQPADPPRDDRPDVQPDDRQRDAP